MQTRKFKTKNSNWLRPCLIIYIRNEFEARVSIVVPFLLAQCTLLTIDGRWYINIIEYGIEGTNSMGANSVTGHMVHHTTIFFCTVDGCFHFFFLTLMFSSKELLVNKQRNWQ